SNFPRRLDRRRKLLVELRRVPVHLRQRQNFFSYLGNGAIAVLVWDQKQRTWHTESRERAVIGHAATCVEQALAPQIDESPAQDWIISVAKDRYRRTLLHPDQVTQLNAGPAQRSVNAFRLFWPETGRLQNNNTRRNVTVMRFVGRDRLRHQIVGV